MDPNAVVNALWGVVILFLILLVIFSKRGRGRIGAGVAGAMYDWQTTDKRRATEVIVQERAGARDPEHADDMPPDAEDAARPR